MLRRRLLLAVALLVVNALPSAAQPRLAGRWQGGLDIMGQHLDIVVVMTGDASALAAAIDVPAQGVKGLPLTNVRAQGEKIHFELAPPTGAGVAVFDGTVQGERITGSFEQSGAKGTFELKRADAVPEPPPPYAQEEVTIPAGNVRLAGTLTLPRTGAPFPAVVLITGSGAQNRDEEVFGFKVFKALADRLTRAGLAVLRCDDRGVGGSTGSVPQSTSADFADDVAAMVGFLRARADVDKSRVGLIGHSEGGLVAPIVATRTPGIAFVVLMSGPALNGEQTLLGQNRLIGRAEGRTEEQVEANARVQRLLFAAARSNKGWEEAAAAIRAEVRASIEQLPEAQRKAIPDVDRVMNQQADGQVAFARSPWFRFFLDYDPAPTLAKLTCPVLALFGERDLQVPVDTNRPVMERALKASGNRDWTIKVIPGANHLYQASTTGAVTEYARLDKNFTPAFTDTLLPWVLMHAGPK